MSAADKNYFKIYFTLFQNIFIRLLIYIFSKPPGELPKILFSLSPYEMYLYMDVIGYVFIFFFLFLEWSLKGLRKISSVAYHKTFFEIEN